MSNSNTAIYSCYYGPDSEKTFLQKEYEGFDCYFVTNNKSVADQAHKKKWTVIFDNLEISDSKSVNAFNSKKVKCMPHIYSELKKYKYLIYVDDKKVFDPNLLLKYGLKSLNNDGSLSLRLHPSNYTNIWCEFGMALLQERYRINKSIMYDYINNMLSLGYKEYGDIYWTSLIIRDMSHYDTFKINELWYKEVVKCGIECQISFFFIAQNFKTIKILPTRALSESNTIIKIFRKIYEKIKFVISN